MVTIEARQPTVSVVIPTHNRARWLAGAIASTLRSPLVEPENVIVVNDDSNDETEEVAQSYGVTYIRGVFRGPSGARNAGFAAATSRYVNFLDDDDEWLPHNMEPQLAALEARAEAGFAFGRAELATDDMVPTGITWPRLPLARGHAPDGLHVDYPQLGAVLFRRDAVAEAGCFDTRIRYHQDADLMLRIATRHSIIGLELVGVLYRDRSPSRQRSDYYWSHREVTTWWPTVVGWRARARFSYAMRRMLATRFLEDATVLAQTGYRTDALVCLGRAWWISPPHFVRRVSDVTRIVHLCTTRSGRVGAVTHGITESR